MILSVMPSLCPVESHTCRHLTVYQFFGSARIVCTLSWNQKHCVSHESVKFRFVPTQVRLLFANDPIGAWRSTPFPCFEESRTASRETVVSHGQCIS